MRWYPAAIGAYLVVSLWTQRSGGSGNLIHDLFGSLVAIFACAALGWFAAARSTRDPDRRAFVALLTLIWVALFGSSTAGMGPTPSSMSRSSLSPVRA